jgi:hypothetical protein
MVDKIYYIIGLAAVTAALFTVLGSWQPENDKGLAASAKPLWDWWSQAGSNR